MTPGDAWQQMEEHLHQQWFLKGGNMPKVGEMIESKYLKQSDLDDDVIVTIRGLDRANVAREDAEPEMKWTIYFKEFDKPMVLNTTNIQLLAKACDSEDTEDWVGKKVVLYVDESVSFAGKITGGLRIRRLKNKGTNKIEDLEDDIPFN